jgi:SAM-dependent methyltransferase
MAPRQKHPAVSGLRRRHWEAVYQRKGDQELSWRQEGSTLSFKLIHDLASSKDCVLDAGGGSSQLSGQLWESGFRCITVVDISARGLVRARGRLQEPQSGIHWLRRDLAKLTSLPKCKVWHDRAVFHFLVRPIQRKAYVENLRRSLEPGGIAIIATFAPNGPESCSGLPVRRYSALQLAAELGEGFVLESSIRERHRTPWGTIQPFVYSVLRRSNSLNQAQQSLGHNRPNSASRAPPLEPAPAAAHPFLAHLGDVARSVRS